MPIFAVERDPKVAGTKPFFEAPIRERGKTLEVEVTKKGHSPIKLALNQETGEFWINDYSFGSAHQFVSVLSRKLHQMQTYETKR